MSEPPWAASRMEVGGIEPPSEKPAYQLSTRLVVLFNFHLEASKSQDAFKLV
jgi:hypothetical protein